METTMRISVDEFKDVLAGFSGSDYHYPHRLHNGITMQLTDGCMYVREYGNAYWLFDIILSWQIKLQNFKFQVWKLVKQCDGSWFIECSDGNNKVIGCQEIECAEFPVDHLEVWFNEGVCLLPAEY